jgi:hypothetical protein
VPNGWETRLAWASRSWEAEVENAQRLATRMNIVLTVALAAAAAGTKVLGDALARRPMDPGHLRLLGGALVGVLFVFVGFARVLVKRSGPRRAAAASFYLLPPEDPGGATVTVDGGPDILERAFLATTAAAYDLYARNIEQKRCLDQAQQLLVVGAALTLLSGALYTWTEARSARGETRWEIATR